MEISSLIKNNIQESGFVTIDKLMSLTSTTYYNSYYRSKLAIGKNEDFITAPEVSGIFGDIIAVWVMENIQKLTVTTEKINIVELGPGRGTLITKILRILSYFPQIYNKISLYLMEVNEKLKKIQQNNLKFFHGNIQWQKDLVIDNNFPTIFIANEFFDALPIKQYIFHNNTFFERVITIRNEKLFFDFIPTEKDFNNYKNVKPGAIIEESQQSIELTIKIARILKNNSGAALIIDYGYSIDPSIRTSLQYNDTLQAIKKHKYSEILHNLGKTDLSAHVDFHRLKEIFTSHTIQNNITSQKNFLEICGINERGQFLVDKFPSKKYIIQKQIEYLTNKMNSFLVLHCYG